MVKLSVLVLVLLFSRIESNAQYNHRIIYHRGDLANSSEFIIKNPIIKSRLVFNDTLSFYDHLNGLNGGKTGMIGKKLVHHSVMYNLNRNLLVEIVNHTGKFMIADDRLAHWTLLKEVSIF